MEFLIELSLDLGIPAHELARRLPYREFALYEKYAIKNMLPTRRLTLQLAQVAQQINMMAGGDAKLGDFLFQPKDEMEEIYETFDFKPRRK